MSNVNDILASFKSSLYNIISDYKDKVIEIEQEEEFNVVLSDFVNYCESDILLLPFYDVSILEKIFERVFDSVDDEFSKIKTARYLIEASKSVDKSHFSQYNDAVDSIKDMYSTIRDFYEKRLHDSSLASDREEYSSIINDYSIIYGLIGDDMFNALIEDVDLFERAINGCELSLEDVSVLLSTAIVSNLAYLDGNGVVSINNEYFIDNSLLESNIQDLNNLLGEQVKE